MKCPTCGYPESAHSQFLWNRHMSMHRTYTKQKREIRKAQTRQLIEAKKKEK